MQEQAGGTVSVSADEAATLVVDGALAAVRRIAPRELVVFDEIAQRWRAGRDRSGAGGAPGGSVGFGVDEALVTALVLDAVAAAVGEVLVRGADHATARWWRRRPPAAAPPTGTTAAATTAAATSAAATSAGGTTAAPTTADARPAATVPAESPAALSREQAERLRAACRRHAVALGLEPAAADLLADAVIGRMSADPDPDQR